MRDTIGGLGAAFRFLTSLPLPGGAGSGLPHLERALPFFPLVGLILGGLLLAVDTLATSLVARPLRDFLLLLGLVVLSGGLHLDGLIDTADGLLAPGAAADRLAAMRESWAGPRGAGAGLLQLLLEYAALSALPEDARRASALLLAPMLGRWAIVQGYVWFPYARRTAGLSLALKQGATWPAALAATAVALPAVCLLCWPFGAALLACAGLVTVLAGLLAIRRLGGMTGDLYGAVEQVVETLTLIAVPILASGAATRGGVWT